MDRLQELSQLVTRLNAVSTEIAAILDRPAQLGHLGEFIAAKLFDIKLAASANNRGFDGKFSDGPLAGKTVDVKTYAKREGIVDLRLRDLPDYYLVLSGPRAAAATSRGTARPWLIDGIYLFDAAQLVTGLLQRGVRVGVATSVAAEYWTPAELYPKSTSRLLKLRPEQREWLGRFGREPAKALHALADIKEDSPSTCIGVIRDLARPYANGTPNLEIHVAVGRAVGLPHKLDKRVPLRLAIDGAEFHAGLRSTARNSYVWICPDIVRSGGEKTTLGRVLTDAGFRSNEKVRLSMSAGLLSVSRS